MRHGTTTGYRSGCRCFECRVAVANQRREYEHRIRDGEKFSYRPDEARAHLEKLLAAGMSKSAIAKEAGVTTQMLRDLINHNTGWILARSHHGIMGVSTDDGVMRPGWKVRLMVAYMQKAGITTADIAKALGRTAGDVRRVLAHETHQPLTVRRFAVLYEHLARSGVVPGELLKDVST